MQREARRKPLDDLRLVPLDRGAETPATIALEMNLPDGIKHAIQLGANEAFMEWTCDPSEDNLEQLGASYQGIGEAAASEADAARYIADLASWDDGSVEGSGATKFEALILKAGIELARGLIAGAANVGTVPDRVKPYMSELAPLVAELKNVLANGNLDEEWLIKTIWG